MGYMAYRRMRGLGRGGAADGHVVAHSLQPPRRRRPLVGGVAPIACDAPFNVVWRRENAAEALLINHHGGESVAWALLLTPAGEALSRVDRRVVYRDDGSPWRQSVDDGA